MTTQLDLLAAPPSGFDLRAMSFARPWGEAIVRPVPPGATAPHAKRIDNRRRQPGERVGKWIAVRTTQTVDAWGLTWLRDTYGYSWTSNDLAPAGVILGAARVTGCVTSGVHPWYFGPTWVGEPNVGWVLGDVVTLATPVPFVPKFGLGLAPLPPAVYEAVVAQLVAAGATP